MAAGKASETGNRGQGTVGLMLKALWFSASVRRTVRPGGDAQFVYVLGDLNNFGQLIEQPNSKFCFDYSMNWRRGMLLTDFFLLAGDRSIGNRYQI